MALPFFAGLILGGGVVLAYNNRNKISKAIQDNSTLKKGKQVAQKTLATFTKEVSAFKSTKTQSSDNKSKSSKTQRVAKTN